MREGNAQGAAAGYAVAGNAATPVASGQLQAQVDRVQQTISDGFDRLSRIKQATSRLARPRPKEGAIAGEKNLSSALQKSPPATTLEERIERLHVSACELINELHDIAVELDHAV